MLRMAAVAGAIAALAVCAPAVATAGAKRGGSDGGGCSGAYVVAKDAASVAKASAAILCLVNSERAARGLRALRASTQLATAATRHSDDVIARKALTHTSANGDGVQERVSRTGYRWRAVAETLDWGASTRSMPARLVATLLQSGVHRPIVLDPSYRDLGVGLVAGSPTRKAAGPASTLTLVFGST